MKILYKEKSCINCKYFDLHPIIDDDYYICACCDLKHYSNWQPKEEPKQNDWIYLSKDKPLNICLDWDIKDYEIENYDNNQWCRLIVESWVLLVNGLLFETVTKVRIRKKKKLTLEERAERYAENLIIVPKDDDCREMEYIQHLVTEAFKAGAKDNEDE